MSAGDNPHHLLRTGAKGRRAFAGVQNTQTPRRAGADVNQPSPGPQRRRHFIHDFRYLRQVRRYRLRHLLIFLVYHRQHVDSGEGVNVGAVGVASLGQQFAQVDTHKNLVILSCAQYKEFFIPFM